MKLTTHPNYCKGKSGGDIHPFPHTSLRDDAYIIKNWDNFAFKLLDLSNDAFNYVLHSVKF